MASLRVNMKRKAVQCFLIFPKRMRLPIIELSLALNRIRIRTNEWPITAFSVRRCLSVAVCQAYEKIPQCSVLRLWRHFSHARTCFSNTRHQQRGRWKWNSFTFTGRAAALLVPGGVTSWPHSARATLSVCLSRRACKCRWRSFGARACCHCDRVTSVFRGTCSSGRAVGSFNT